MAGALVQQLAHAHNQTDANPDTTMSLTGVVAGHALVLCTSTPQSGFKITSVTDSAGDTWTKVVEKVSGASDTVQIWVAANVSAGTHTLTITWNTSRNSALNLSEWSGLATSFPTPPNGSSSNASSTSAPSGTATPASGSYLAIAALSTNTAGTRQADAYTDLTNAGSPLQAYGRWAYQAGITAATSTSWTLTTADTSAGAILLLQEAAGVLHTATLTASQGQSASVSTAKQAFLALAASQASAAVLVVSKAFLRGLSAASSPVASVGRLVQKVLSASANTNSQGQFPVILGTTGGPTLTTQLLSAFLKTLTATVSSPASISRFTAKTVSAASSPSATVVPHKPSTQALTVAVSIVIAPVMWFRRALAIVAAVITNLGTPASASQASETLTPATKTDMTIVPDEYA